MRYEAEVQWGFLQVQKAEEPSLQAAIARHDLTERFEEIASTTSALADAIGWSADTARVSPSIRRRAALRGCAQACALADKTLLALLDLLPVGSPEAARVASLLSTPPQDLGLDPKTLRGLQAPHEALAGSARASRSPCRVCKRLTKTLRGLQAPHEDLAGSASASRGPCRVCNHLTRPLQYQQRL
jgi:hypothetical protein